jgi:hypothetical protein
MQALTLQDIKDLAPAALAEAPSARVSPHYSFLPTRAVADALGQEGWVITEARQAYSRLRNPDHAKHQVAFTHRDILAKHLDEVPRIYLSNSHDGGAKFWMRAGVLREICSNGMTVSDGLVQAVGIRHSHRTIEQVIETAQAFRANGDLIAGHIADFKATELSPAAAVEFVRQAIALRFPDDSGLVVEIQAILKPKRSQDVGNDLWRVFNRSQEWLLKGGFPVYTQGAKDWSTRDARAIKAIDESTRLNTGLWSLAEQFSNN